MSELLISLCFPLWVLLATTRGLMGCCAWGITKLAHLVERHAPLRSLETVESALNRVGAELDRRAWKRAMARRVA